MSFISKLFGKDKTEEPVSNPFLVDIHSHLLPGIDDGVDDYEEAVEIIQAFAALGYKKMITTPHVMSDFYQNTPEEILPRLAELRNILKERNIDMQIEASGEYYMDMGLLDLARGKKLLSFGDNYVLVETSFLTESEHLNTFIFDLKIAGYQPILAHPERYTYMHSKPEMYRELHEREIFFQVNLGSLAGYYSRDVKRAAEMLIKEGLVDFVGSDVHHIRHMAPLQAAFASSAFRQLTQMNILNNSLL